MEERKKQKPASSERRRRQRSMIQRSNTVIEVAPVTSPVTRQRPPRLGRRSFSADHDEGLPTGGATTATQLMHARQPSISDGEIDMLGEIVHRYGHDIGMARKQRLNPLSARASSPVKLAGREMDRNSSESKRTEQQHQDCFDEERRRAGLDGTSHARHQAVDGRREQASNGRRRERSVLHGSSSSPRHLSPYRQHHICPPTAAMGYNSLPSSPSRLRWVATGSPCQPHSGELAHDQASHENMNDSQLSVEDRERSNSPQLKIGDMRPLSPSKKPVEDEDRGRKVRHRGQLTRRQSLPSVPDNNLQIQSDSKPRFERSNSVDILPRRNIVITKSRRSVDVGRICAATSQAMNRSYETLSQDIDNYYSLLQAEINRCFDISDMDGVVKEPGDGTAASSESLEKSCSTPSLNISPSNSSSGGMKPQTPVYRSHKQSYKPHRDHSYTNLSSPEHSSKLKKQSPSLHGTLSDSPTKGIPQATDQHDKVIENLEKYYSSLIAQTDKCYGSLPSMVPGSESLDSDSSKSGASKCGSSPSYVSRMPPNNQYNPSRTPRDEPMEINPFIENTEGANGVEEWRRRHPQKSWRGTTEGDDDDGDDNRDDHVPFHLYTTKSSQENTGKSGLESDKWNTSYHYPYVSQQNYLDSVHSAHLRKTDQLRSHSKQDRSSGGSDSDSMMVMHKLPVTVNEKKFGQNEECHKDRLDALTCLDCQNSRGTPQKKTKIYGVDMVENPIMGRRHSVATDNPASMLAKHYLHSTKLHDPLFQQAYYNQSSQPLSSDEPPRKGEHAKKMQNVIGKGPGFNQESAFTDCMEPNLPGDLANDSTLRGMYKERIPTTYTHEDPSYYRSMHESAMYEIADLKKQHGGSKRGHSTASTAEEFTGKNIDKLSYHSSNWVGRQQAHDGSNYREMESDSSAHSQHSCHQLNHAKSSESSSSSLADRCNDSLSSNAEKSNDSFNSSCLDKYADSLSSYNEKSTTNSLSSLHERDTASIHSLPDRYDSPLPMSDGKETLVHAHGGQANLFSEHLCRLCENSVHPSKHHGKDHHWQEFLHTSNLMCEKHHRSFAIQPESAIESGSAIGKGGRKAITGHDHGDDIVDKMEKISTGQNAIEGRPNTQSAEFESLEYFPSHSNAALEKYYAELISDTAKRTGPTIASHDRDSGYFVRDEPPHARREICNEHNCDVVQDRLMGFLMSQREQDCYTDDRLPIGGGIQSGSSFETYFPCTDDILHSMHTDISHSAFNMDRAVSLGELHSPVEVFYNAVSPLTARRFAGQDLSDNQAESSNTDDDRQSACSNNDENYDTCSSDMDEEGGDTFHDKAGQGHSVDRSQDKIRSEQHTNKEDSLPIETIQSSLQLQHSQSSGQKTNFNQCSSNIEDYLIATEGIREEMRYGGGRRELGGIPTEDYRQEMRYGGERRELGGNPTEDYRQEMRYGGERRELGGNTTEGFRQEMRYGGERRELGGIRTEGFRQEMRYGGERRELGGITTEGFREEKRCDGGMPERGGSASRPRYCGMESEERVLDGECDETEWVENGRQSSETSMWRGLAQQQQQQVPHYDPQYRSSRDLHQATRESSSLLLLHDDELSTINENDTDTDHPFGERSSERSNSFREEDEDDQGKEDAMAMDKIEQHMDELRLADTGDINISGNVDGVDRATTESVDTCEKPSEDQTETCIGETKVTEEMKRSASLASADEIHRILAISRSLSLTPYTGPTHKKSKKKTRDRSMSVGAQGLPTKRDEKPRKKSSLKRKGSVSVAKTTHWEDDKLEEMRYAGGRGEVGGITTEDYRQEMRYGGGRRELGGIATEDFRQEMRYGGERRELGGNTTEDFRQEMRYGGERRELGGITTEGFRQEMRYGGERRELGGNTTEGFRQEMRYGGERRELGGITTEDYREEKRCDGGLPERGGSASHPRCCGMESEERVLDGECDETEWVENGRQSSETSMWRGLAQQQQQQVPHYDPQYRSSRDLHQATRESSSLLLLHDDELSTINENDTDTDHPFGERSSERSNSFREEDEDDQGKEDTMAMDKIEQHMDELRLADTGDINISGNVDGVDQATTESVDTCKKPSEDQTETRIGETKVTEEMKRSASLASADEIHRILAISRSLSLTPYTGPTHKKSKKKTRDRSMSVGAQGLPTKRDEKPRKKSSLKRKGSVSVAKTTHWEDDKLEEGERIVKKIATNVSEIIISMTTPKSSQNPLYILFNFLEVSPQQARVKDGGGGGAEGSGGGRSSQDGYWTVVQAMQQHDQFLEGMLLKNVDPNSHFPYLHYVVFNTSKEGRFIQEPQWAKILEEGYGPRQAIGQVAYEEMYTFIDPSLPFLPKRSNNPNVAYIICGFRTLGGVDHLDQTWSIWSGADFIVANIPPNLKLQRLTLHKRVMPTQAALDERLTASPSRINPSTTTTATAATTIATTTEPAASSQSAGGSGSTTGAGGSSSTSKKTGNSAGSCNGRQTKNMSVGTGPFSYVLMCELSEALSDVMRTREFIERIKSRECGFTSLYMIDHFF